MDVKVLKIRNKGKVEMGKNNLENRVGEQVKCMKSSGKNERSYHNVEV